MSVAHSFLLLLLLLIPMLQQYGPITHTIPLRGVYHKEQRPDLTLQTWWSGGFQNGYDRWHRENFGFRSTLIRIRNQKDYMLYGKAHADKIIVGKNGYLFEEGYLSAWSGTDALGETRVREIAGMLLDIQNGLKKQGKTFLVIMAPGKASFFPEFVPSRYAAVRQPRNNGEEMSSIFQDAGVNLIDFNRDYMARKKTSPYPLFGRTGIHWSNYGTALSMQEFIAWVEKERQIDLPDYLIRGISMSDKLKDPDGDLGELINLMYPIPEYPMAIIDGEWESSEGHETPRMTAFADSFFQQFILNNIVPGCFREIDYYYYSALVWRSSNGPANVRWDPATKEAALKSVDDSDVILFLATEANYSGIGFGYLDALHEHLKSPPETVSDKP